MGVNEAVWNALVFLILEVVFGLNQAQSILIVEDRINKQNLHRMSLLHFEGLKHYLFYELDLKDNLLFHHLEYRGIIHNRMLNKFFLPKPPDVCNALS